MINCIRKYIFANKVKNMAAPHIFIVLCVYTVITSAYTGLFFGALMFTIRSALSLILTASYVLIEKSPLSVTATTFCFSAASISILVFGALYMDGDFLLFTYMNGIAMISLTYMRPKAIMAYIAFSGAPLAVIVFLLRIQILGEAYSMIHHILFFITSVVINILIYILCKSYAQALDALTEAKNEATVAANAKGTFLSTMSHEIRTPINAIMGMTNIGLASEDIERKNYALNMIENASSHLLGIVNDILDISKIEAGKLDLLYDEFVFEKMLQTVLNVISSRIDEKKQKLEVHTDDNIPEVLIGDEQRLVQVILNLMSNAIKFTPAEGRVRLEISLTGKSGAICTIKFKVIDSGIGISPEQQARLFQPFQQAENSTNRKFGGTGLGLSISKHIIEMMGGSIWIESELGKGAAFSFVVRMKRGELKPLPPSAAAEAAGQRPGNAGLPVNENEAVVFSGKRILLAEDIDINREIVLELLKPSMLEIDCAVNGEAAVRMFGAAPEIYDLIFMDVQMPEMDGFEATRQIRALDVPWAKEVPIIAMTANVLREDVEKCFKFGMNDHVGKPFSLDEVLAVLQKYLSK